MKEFRFLWINVINRCFRSYLPFVHCKYVQLPFQLWKFKNQKLPSREICPTPGVTHLWHNVMATLDYSGAALALDNSNSLDTPQGRDDWVQLNNPSLWASQAARHIHVHFLIIQHHTGSDFSLQPEIIAMVSLTVAY